ncbi:MAG: UDP-N-acetylmuramate dehydrogenase [Bacteroidota bacterium]|nr:UDP-N-acetylmuramate dehydrogenase [Bacteroidota bacterium]
MKISRDISLKQYNTFGIDITAKYFTEVGTIEELQDLLKLPEFKNIPKLVLGGGSNLLFTQDYNGLVIKINIKGSELIKEDENHLYIKCGAGLNWHEFVLECLDKGYAGLENLSLIPGTVGAAPMQNIGAYGVEIKDIFHELEAVDIASGTLHKFDNSSCKFGYRYSIFKDEAKGKYIIVSVTFRLNKKPIYNISYGAIQDTMKEMGLQEVSINSISKAVIHIRQSKLPDPKEIGNAGSFFKNPTISKAEYQLLKEQYPEIPGYEVDDQSIKVPAGWLIEKCGWKGKKIGQTGVHKNQALVLVNYGNAKGKEIENLAYQIQDSVKEKFGIELNPEVNIV